MPDSADNKERLLARLDSLSEKAISTYDQILEYGKPKEQLETAKDILNRTGVTRQARTGEGASISLSPEVITGALQMLAHLATGNRPDEINVTYEPIEGHADQPFEDPPDDQPTDEPVDEPENGGADETASPPTGESEESPPEGIPDRFLDQIGG